MDHAQPEVANLSCLGDTKVFEIQDVLAKTIASRTQTAEPKETIIKVENLWNSHWCLIRTHHNYPISGTSVCMINFSVIITCN